MNDPHSHFASQDDPNNVFESKNKRSANDERASNISSRVSSGRAITPLVNHKGVPKINLGYSTANNYQSGSF